MRKVIYYVATSLDGFISGPEGDISGFAARGEGVEQYQKDLQAFDTVIMGRNTYEFGYQYGLKPGQPAYPHMKHFIFSDSMQLKDCHPNVKVVPRDIEIIKKLKSEKGTNIYLCGGGIFAGWLMEHSLIDVLKIKLNPFIMGKGIRLFENLNQQIPMQLLNQKTYKDGLQILEYEL